MADSFVRLPPDSTGKRLDTEQLTVGANTVERGRYQLTGAAAAEIADIANAVPGATDYGLVVRQAPYISPQMSTASDTNISPASTATLNSTQLTAGTTGYLVKVFIAAAVPLKAELQTVSDAVASSTLTVWFSHQLPVLDVPRGFVSVAYSASVGLDGFRVVLTNLDAALTTDVYATFLWDEE